MQNKCHLYKDGRLSICTTLLDACQEQRSGINQKFIFNLEYGQHVGTIIVLHSGKFKKKGVVLNYCPFCGMRIYKEKP